MNSIARMDAQINEPVEFRAGDGPLLQIPEGPCQVIVSDDSATLTWNDEGEVLTTAIPKMDFDRYIQDGKITLGSAR
jgi:hypothetical protein